MNIIDIITKLISSGDTLKKLASLLDTDESQAGKAIGAAIPAIVASLIGVASKPEGASKLSGILSDQPDDFPDDLSTMFGFAAEQGAGSDNPLSALTGGGLGKLVGALSKFTKLGEGGIGKLIGMLTPLILGILKKQSKGMDAAGLASMLLGQKSAVKSAMPAGLGSVLASAIPSVGNLFDEASDTAAAAADQVKQTGSSIGRWIMPLILIGLALLVLPKMCSGPSDAGKDAIGTASDGTQMIADITGQIKDATSALTSITDPASAATAVPKLEAVNQKLTGMASLWSKLPGAVQSTVSAALKPMIDKLEKAAAPALMLPVAGPQIKPLVDKMVMTLKGFTV